MSKEIEPGWESLYKISGWAAILGAVLIPLSIVAFFFWPIYPDNIFRVIQQSRIAGVMSLDFMYTVSNIVAIPIFLALYLSLKETDRGWALIALVLGFIGLVALVPARPIAEMLTLSDKYAAATSEAQQAIYLAAGEATMAAFRGTAYYVHYVLGTISLLISAFLMLRSPLFGKAAATVGIVSNLAAFGLFIPQIGVYISILSVLGLLVWWVQIAQVFLRLGRR
jgi:hypothetical protein